MLPNINSTLEIFERLSLDEKAYFTFKNEEKIAVCIYYIKKPDNRNWSIWFELNEAASKQTISANYLPSVIRAFKVKESDFVSEIVGALLLQTSYANEFIVQISEFIGIEAVTQSILQSKEFMDNLSQAVKNTFSNETPSIEKKEDKKKKFRIVK